MESAARVFDNTLALKLADELCRIIDNGDEKADILIKSADIKWLIGRWDDADKDITAAANLISSGSIHACEIHRFKGIAAFFRGDFGTALGEFEQGFALAEHHNDPLQLCVAYSNLGIWHQHHKKFTEAISFHSKSLELAKSLQENQRQAKTLSNLGLIYMEQGEFSKAEASFLQSLAISEEQRSLRDESIALGNLAWAYMNNNRSDDALPYLNRKLALATQMNDKLETIKALGNIGNIQDKHEYTEA